MPTYCALAILSLLVASGLYGGQLPQDSSARQRGDELSSLERESLNLNAQLLDVKVKNYPDGIHAVLNLRVRFTVRNNLKRTLFVVPEAKKIVAIRLAESSDMRSEPYLLDRTGLPSFKQLELLRIQNHRSSRVKSVLPGANWEWETDIPMVVSLDDNRSSSPQEVIKRHAGWTEVTVKVEEEVGLESLRKLDAIWCQFEIRFWPHNMEEEGELLQQNWKNHGMLLQEPLTSSPIRFNLKK